MINIIFLITLLVFHFLGDFILQSDWMALNKSKNLLALTIHCLVYSAVFLGFGWYFASLVFLTHFITDFFTSRLTSYLWSKNERHWFFVVIGADQLIHQITLIGLFIFTHAI